MSSYQTAVLDCPWKYKTPGWLGGTDRHYETLPYEALVKMPINTLVSENAHLWMWTTDAHIEQALDLIRAWGFERRALFPWVKMTSKAGSNLNAAADETLILQNGQTYKLAYGNGYYGRSVAEFLILATRGKNIILHEGRHVRKIIHAPVGDHSEKPNVAYTIIENMSPGPRIDLFGRAPRRGFDVWGREAVKAVNHDHLAVWGSWAELTFQRKPEQEDITSQLTKTGEASGHEENLAR